MLYLKQMRKFMPTLINVRMTNNKFVKSILTATDEATHGRNVRLANPE